MDKKSLKERYHEGVKQRREKQTKWEWANEGVFLERELMDTPVSYRVTVTKKEAQ